MPGEVVIEGVSCDIHINTCRAFLGLTWSKRYEALTQNDRAPIVMAIDSCQKTLLFCGIQIGLIFGAEEGIALLDK